jgi:hypothetical protein
MKRIEDGSDRGSISDREVTFAIDVKGGEIHHMHGERTQSHDSMGSDGQRGRMSNMNSVFHQSIASECFHQFHRGRLLINRVGCH